MSLQVLVIGLGQFGMSLARSLAARGNDVIAVDSRPDHIAEIAPHVSDAIHLDAMDADALAELSPERRDICVCAIGDDNREASIIVTALLRQFAAPRIVARATDDLHARILSLVGAHEVLHPERDYGERLAMRLTWKNVVETFPFGAGLVVSEIRVPASLAGRTLRELELRRRFRVTVAAHVSSDLPSDVSGVPDPDRALRDGDLLILVGSPDDIRTLSERI